MASATTGSPESLDYWRCFFRSTSSDIIEVIECAILVATSDCPKELQSRRDQITEKLYASRLPQCYGYDHAEQPQASEGRGEEEEEEESGAAANKESNPVGSNYSFNEAEALTEEMEEETETVGEVMRIKELLAAHQDESDNVLFDSLRRLQLMDLSVETLKATDIGRAVNVLRRHGSKQIRHLVRTLIEDWKVLVDEWVSATAAISDDPPASTDPLDGEEEEGLPSPPLDEGAFLATSIQLSGFFDGMDDDGNLTNSCEFEPVTKQHTPDDNVWTRKQEQVIRQVKPLEAPNGDSNPQHVDKGHMRRQESSARQTRPQGIGKEEMRRQEPVIRQTRPQDAHSGRAAPHVIGDEKNKLVTAESGPGRPQKLPSEKKTSSELNDGFQLKSQSCLPDRQSKHGIINSGPGRPQNLSSERRTSNDMNASLQKRQPASLHDKVKNSETASLTAKLDAAKRKLQENYQQAENAKKQRTIQVMELQDIPKKAHINKQPVHKPSSNIRNLLKRRR